MIPTIINENKYLYYELILYTATRKPLLVIPFETISFTNKFNDYNELSFSVGKYLYNSKIKGNVINPAWEKIEQDLLGKLIQYEVTDGVQRKVFEEFFSINQPSFSEDADNTMRNYSCVSAHQAWFNRVKLRGMDSTRQLLECDYDKLKASNGKNVVIDYEKYRVIENGSDRKSSFDPTDYTKGGVLNYILETLLNKEWTVAYYDPTLLEVANVTIPSEVVDNLFKAAEYKIDEENENKPLVEGVNVYWNFKGTSEGRKLINKVLSFSNSIEDNLLTYIKGTQADVNALEAMINSFGGEKSDETDITNLLLIRNSEIEEIINNPLKGAEYLDKLEQGLMAAQVLVQDVSGFSFIESSQEILSEFYQSVSDLCNAILYKGIVPLYSYYKNAVGLVPYRDCKFEASSLVEVFQKLQESFLCFFEFDNVNKQIYIYSRSHENINETRNLILSPDNYIISMDYQSTTDQIVTRLYPTGKDNLKVGAYNITGLNFVDDFSYFINKNKMSEALANKIIKYQKLIADLQKYQDEYLNESTEYNYGEIISSLGPISCQSYDSNKNRTMRVFSTIKQLQSEITVQSNNLAEATAIAKEYKRIEGSDIPVNSTESAAAELAYEAEVEKMNADFQIYTTSFYTLERMASSFYNLASGAVSENYIALNISSYTAELINWQKRFQMQNVIDPESYDSTKPYESNEKLFTEEDIQELQSFVYEEDITWDSISNAATLYKYAVEYLQYINTIPITLSVDLLSVFDSNRHQLDWNKFRNMGAYFYVEMEDFHLNYNKFKYMEYTHTISADSQSFNATLSNTYDLQNIYNQVVSDIWSYSYQQIQDINQYRKTWEDYIQKQENLLLQGDTIRADVNNIVDSAGRTVVGSNGLAVSKAAGNKIKRNADGYYASSVYTTAAPSSTQTPVVPTGDVEPNKVAFINGGSAVQYYSDNGTLTIDLSQTGSGGSSSANSGLPRYYSAPYFSEKLKALDARVEYTKDTTVYYQEMKDTEYVWYQHTIALNSPTYQATIFSDNFNISPKGLWWIVNGITKDSTTEQIKSAVKLATMMTTQEPIIEGLTNEKKNLLKVMLYGTVNDSDTQLMVVKRQTSANAEHLPEVIWGIGSGIDNQGKLYIQKTEDGANIWYQSRTSESSDPTRDSQSRARGIALRDTGIYQIRGSLSTNNMSKIPFIFTSEQTSIEEAMEEITTAEVDDWVVIKASN